MESTPVVAPEVPKTVPKVGPVKPTPEQRKILQQAQLVLPLPVLMRLRQAFTPRGALFFQFYIDLKSYELGFPVPPDLRMIFTRYANILAQITSPVDHKPLSPNVINQLAESRSQMNMLLNRLVQGKIEDNTTWAKINDLIGPIITLAARDKEVYLAYRQVGARHWYVFRRMNPSQADIEKLRDEDPEAFVAIQKYRMTLKDIDTNIEKKVRRSRLIPEKTFLVGAPAIIGKDPVTGEKSVFDRDGDVLPVADYIKKRVQRVQGQARLSMVPERTQIPISDMRLLPDKDVDELPGKVSMSSITDDRAKQGRLTRIFATKPASIPILNNRIESRQVIVSGRYKGIFLDDMVNGEGRMIEGTAYTYNPSTGRTANVPVHMDPAQREPYVTTAVIPTKYRHNGKTVTRNMTRLFVKIPSGRQYTKLRQIMRGTCCNSWDTVKKDCISSIVWDEDQGQTAGFYFDPKDFALISDIIQGMSLSSSAMTLIRDYYKELSTAEEATTQQNLPHYSAEQLGGFVAHLKNGRPFDLLNVQKKFLAWMDANGNKGVCALDTGIGKCVRGDTLINTSKGIVPIQDMKPGPMEPDTVKPLENWEVLIEGEPVPVINFYYGGTKPTLKVRTRYGYEVEGSLIHPVLIRHQGGESFQQLPELTAGDFVCLVRDSGGFPKEEPDLRVPVRTDFSKYTNGLVMYPVPNRMSPDLARLLGYIIAEGWTRSQGGFNISQHSDKNPEVRADIEALLKSQFGWEAGPEYDIGVQSKYLRVYLEWLGVDYTLSADKCFPPVILRSTRESLAAFIRALVDAECYSVPNGGIEFCSASERLARELQIALLRFGIVSSRKPKRVKSYDQVYWRLMITGDNARRYQQEIGLVSQRKIDATEGIANKKPNPNHDVIPFVIPLVEALRKDIFDAIGGSGKDGGVYKKYGSSFVHTLTHIRQGRRNPSYQFLKWMLKVADENGIPETPAVVAVRNIVARNWFFDPIETVETGFKEVMDIEVGDPRHCFVGNGLVNHNTLSSIAAMKKMGRDGLEDVGAEYTTPTGKKVKTNGRYLYVCLPQLRGGFGADARKFLTDAKILTNKVDVMSYGTFSGASKRGTWKKQPWNPAAYIAIFFDESQRLLRTGSGASQAALKLWHPRKICMTASPMEKKPMEAYVMAAISNNTELFGRTPEAKANRADMRRFKERYCEAIGGRVIGVRQDPVTKKSLQTWVKRNIYYADKLDVEEFNFKNVSPLTKKVVPVEMHPQVEVAYRTVTTQFASILGGMVAKFRDRGLSTDPNAPKATNPDIERSFGNKFKPVILLLNDLANDPEKAFRTIVTILETDLMPDGKPLVESMIPLVRQWKKMFNPDELRATAAKLPNPKLDAAELEVRNKLDRTNGSSRTIFYSDDKELCARTCQRMSQTIVGKHALALANSIRVFDGTGEIKEISFEMDPVVLEKLVRDPVEREQILKETGGVSHHKLPFVKRAYRKHPALPSGPGNPRFRVDQWQTFVLNEVIQPDRSIRTLTLDGKIYSLGQNLQAFDTVVHLDRDTWNAEMMKQRTARAWRQGQTQPVDEVTIDSVYRATDGGQERSDFDKTLDQIRSYFQEMDSEIFQRIIRDSMSAELGEEWKALHRTRASGYRLDRKTMDLMTSPYASRSEVPEE